MNNLQKKQELFVHFSSELANLNGTAKLIQFSQTAKELSLILKQMNANCVAGWESVVPDGIRMQYPEGKWLNPESPVPADYQSYFGYLKSAEAAILPVDFLIAETATIVLSSKTVPGRMLSLLPPAVIFIASVEQLYPDLFTFHREYFSGAADFGSQLMYITGSSRTSDIEKVLILGVHGPKNIFVLVQEG